MGAKSLIGRGGERKTDREVNEAEVAGAGVGAGAGAKVGGIVGAKAEIEEKAVGAGARISTNPPVRAPIVKLVIAHILLPQHQSWCQILAIALLPRNNLSKKKTKSRC